MTSIGVDASLRSVREYPAPRAVLELLKPVTWFPPMWAFACGAVSSGVPLSGRWSHVALGLVITGPLVCASSQAANDWYDRHVDAINEPHRPIPSGRMPRTWGFKVAVLWTALSLVAAIPLGSVGVLAWDNAAVMRSATVQDLEPGRRRTMCRPIVTGDEPV